MSAARQRMATMDRNLLIGWVTALTLASSAAVIAGRLQPRPLAWPAVPVVSHRAARSDTILLVRVPPPQVPALPVPPQVKPQPHQVGRARQPVRVRPASMIAQERPQPEQPIAVDQAQGQVTVDATSAAAANAGQGGPQTPAAAGPQAAVAEPEDVDSPPTPLTQPPPAYPDWARQSGATALVVARFVVTAAGTVEALQIQVVRGDARFAGSAAAAVRTWTFEPARRNGVAVAVRVEQQLVFELDD